MQLKRTLGPTQLIFYSVGVIIGAGVYSVIGAAAAVAQDGLWFSFVIGGLVALLTGFSYAEMTTSFPAAGAEYTYIRRALPGQDWLAFMVAMTILIGASATASTVAVAFGGYLREFVDLPVAVSALLLLVGCTVLNVIGLRESSWTNVLFTTIEVGGLVLVIAAGLSTQEFGEPMRTPLQPGAIQAAAILFFVYLGFEEIANLTEEVRHPSRDLPRAIFASLGITTLLYVLVSLSVLALASPSDLAASNAPLALAVESVWPKAGPLMSAIALFSTANTVLITLIATSRLLFSMGRDGELPAKFASLTTRGQTPAVAAALTLAVAAILVPLGNIKILAEASSFAALLAFLAVNLSLIVLRYRAPDHQRPFRVPLSIGRMPLLPLAAIASILLLLVNFERGIYVSGCIAMAGAGFVYIVRRAWSRSGKRAS